MLQIALVIFLLSTPKFDFVVKFEIQTVSKIQQCKDAYSNDFGMGMTNYSLCLSE